MVLLNKPKAKQTSTPVPVTSSPVLALTPIVQTVSVSAPVKSTNVSRENVSNVDSSAKSVVATPHKPRSSKKTAPVATPDVQGSSRISDSGPLNETEAMRAICILFNPDLNNFGINNCSIAQGLTMDSRDMAEELEISEADAITIRGSNTSIYGGLTQIFNNPDADGKIKDFYNQVKVVVKCDMEYCRNKRKNNEEVFQSCNWDFEDMDPCQHEGLGRVGNKRTSGIIQSGVAKVAKACKDSIDNFGGSGSHDPQSFMAFLHMTRTKTKSLYMMYFYAHKIGGSPLESSMKMMPDDMTFSTTPMIKTEAQLETVDESYDEEIVEVKPKGRKRKHSGKEDVDDKTKAFRSMTTYFEVKTKVLEAHLERSNRTRRIYNIDDDDDDDY